MKVGDLVQFTNVNSTYAKWFYSHLAIATKVSVNSRGVPHCAVRWLQPVKYFESWTSTSHFKQANFTVMKHNKEKLGELVR